MAENFWWCKFCTNPCVAFRGIFHILIYDVVFCWSKSWEASIWTTCQCKTAIAVQRWWQGQSFCYGHDHTIIDNVPRIWLALQMPRQPQSFRRAYQTSVHLLLLFSLLYILVGLTQSFFTWKKFASFNSLYHEAAFETLYHTKIPTTWYNHFIKWNKVPQWAGMDDV